jgi:Subtilase family/FG-GAP-like repeat
MNSKRAFFMSVSVQIARRWIVVAGVLAIAAGTMPSSAPLVIRAQAQASASDAISAEAMAQINALLREKASRGPVERKINSQLLYAMRAARGQAIAAGVASLEVALPYSSDNRLILDVRANVSGQLLQQLRQSGAEILQASAAYRSIQLRVDLNQVDAIAALPDVSYVQPKQAAMTNRFDGAIGASPVGRQSARRDGSGGLVPVRRAMDRTKLTSLIHSALGGPGAISDVGSKNSEGDVTHKANVARATFHVDGTGVKVGVLSDGVTNLAGSQALGDLGPVTVLPGQTGSGDEGTAMLEIIHDLAPGAQLYFATAFTSITSFAQNIRDLRAAGCDIIVDDVSYFVETPFQDGQTLASPTNGGVVIQAVKDVTAAGALYFSSAGNAGNVNDGTAGVWEGDFVDGGAAGPPISGIEAGQLHRFPGGLNFDTLNNNNTSRPITLFWSDPLGASGNDYDLFRLDSTGATVLAASTDLQTGTQDPFEAVTGGSTGQRVVVVKFAGVARFLHLNTNRGRLSVATVGQTHGHSTVTAPFSFGVAATPASGPFPNPFNSSNSIETFSSDGPRRIFYGSSGTPITPGNVSSTGGALLSKPDLTAADGVSVTGVGGFPSPFFGTSAAAPHAAAIAALVKSVRPGLTQAQIKSALLGSAIDIEAVGGDRDSGVGIIMADTAVAAITPVVARTRDGDFDGDGKADITVYRPSTGTWYTLKSSTSTLSSVTWGSSTDIPVPADYDGDGKIDVAVYRPSTGTWYILKSSTSTLSSVTWGSSTDLPVPADYDGDGKADVAIFRPSTGTWYILQSSTSTLASVTWGIGTDLPVPGYYDGDAKADITVYRPSTGTWYILQSSSLTLQTVAWGAPGLDVPVIGDYDGDGRTDIAVFRPSTGTWYILRSAAGFLSVGWGSSTDIPVPADYDGDGKADVAVYRPTAGTWYILKSSTLTLSTVAWGSSSDIPVTKRP